MESKGFYEFFDHVADIGIRAQADSLVALFVIAGSALMDFIGPQPEGSPEVSLDVLAEGEDLEELMVRWLQELLYVFQQGHKYVTRVREIHLEGKKLRATVLGKEWSESSLHDFREVKAITYHQLRVIREGNTWSANIILDV